MKKLPEKLKNCEIHTENALSFNLVQTTLNTVFGLNYNSGMETADYTGLINGGYARLNIYIIKGEKGTALFYGETSGRFHDTVINSYSIEEFFNIIKEARRVK